MISQLFLQMVLDVGVAGVLDIICDKISLTDWLLIGVGLAAEIVAAFATGGITLAANIVSAGVLGYGVLSSIQSVLKDCADSPSQASAPSNPPSPEPTTEPTVTPTLEPTLGPEPRLTPTLEPPTTPQPTTSSQFTHQSGVFGDPHLSTFDCLCFDCQASGEFTMVKSLDTTSFMIQERFTAVGSDVCSQASVSTGIAIAKEGLPIIQLSIPRDDDTGSDVVGGCPVDLFVDGTQDSISTGSDIEGIDIVVSGNAVQVTYPLTGVYVWASIRNSVDTFGCFFLVQVFLPFSYRPDERIIGLLGKLNGNPDDDWVDPDGKSYLPPENQADSIFSVAYNYCVSNWCIQDEDNSIFTYKSNESFASINGCNKKYANQIKKATANAGDELVAICGTDKFCLIDGICGNLNNAAAAIEDAALVKAAQDESDPIPSAAPSIPVRGPSADPVATPTSMPLRSPTPRARPPALTRPPTSRGKWSKSRKGKKKSKSMKRGFLTTSREKRSKSNKGKSRTIKRGFSAPPS